MAQQSLNQPAPFWMHSSEHVDPDVFAAAAAEWRWALDYCHRILGDTSETAELLEECVYAVSRVVFQRRAASRPPIEGLRAYLRRVFIRRLWRTRNRLLCHGPLMAAALVHRQDLDTPVLLDQLQAFMDVRTCRIYQDLVAGEEWPAIAERLGLSTHAAQALYHYGLLRARKRVLNHKRPPPDDNPCSE
jgi:hypothetical protein